MKIAKKLIFISLACMMLTLCSPVVSAAGDAKSLYYAYNYDAWGDARESPNPFTAEFMLTGSELGIGNYKDPQGLFVRGDSVYIVDTGNNRIVECNAELKLVRVIDEFNMNDGDNTFNAPHDVFVTETFELIIADTNNQRIVHLDNELNVLKIITKPPDALMEDISEFLPVKLVADDGERIFLLARNMNKGIMVFSGDGVFTGFIGANKVNFDIVDMIWKRVFSTRAQREQMMLFVPTEYSNISMDHKGFMYTTCSTIAAGDLITVAGFEDSDLLATLFGTGSSSNVQPICRLNAMGVDVLIRNGWVAPIGDWDWSDVGSIKGPSRFIDIVSTDNDCYFALDRTRGRIFAYDFQGNLLYVFGGYGNKLGYFSFPTAIEHINGNLLVLDSRSAALTVFTPTEYGLLIAQALSEYKTGNYEQSAQLWERVLVFNVNYDLAYIGIGRSLLRQERYKEAMDLFKLKLDHTNYSKAFQQYRKQVIEQNVPFIIAGFIAIVVLRAVFKRRRTIASLIRRLRKHPDDTSRSVKAG